jgi:hypothetical protein
MSRPLSESGFPLRPRPRRYRAMPSSTTPPAFQCGAASFDLERLVAVVDGNPIYVRPQEGRLLGSLLRAGGRVVAYEQLVVELYGARLPLQAARVRLKALVADVRRRFGRDMKQALRTAPSRGLVLQLGSLAVLEGFRPCRGEGSACAGFERSTDACRAFGAEFSPASNLSVSDTAATRG